MPYLSLHQGGPHCWPCPDHSLRLRPTRLSDPPRLFPWSFLYQWPALAHTSDFLKSPKKQYLASACPVFLVKWPQASTSSIWMWFTAWLLLGSHLQDTSKSPQVAAICRLFCSSSWLAQAEHRQQSTLACTSWEAPELVYPVDSFMSCWSTTQPPLVWHTQGADSAGTRASLK